MHNNVSWKYAAQKIRHTHLFLTKIQVHQAVKTQETHKQTLPWWEEKDDERGTNEEKPVDVRLKFA